MQIGGTSGVVSVAQAAIKMAGYATYFHVCDLNAFRFASDQYSFSIRFQIPLVISRSAYVSNSEQRSLERVLAKREILKA